MSGLGSLAGAVFKSVSNVAAKVSSAVVGVGKTLFSTGAATGAGSVLSGGFSNLGLGGTLGSVLGGAVTQAAAGALIGGAVGAATGQGFGKGALMGGGIGAVTGAATGFFGASPGLASGLDPTTTNAVPAATPTGAAPTGAAATSAEPVPARFGYDAPAASAAPAALPASTVVQPQATPAPTGGFNKFLTDNGGVLLAGLGQGAGKYLEAQEASEEKQKDRDFLEDKETRLRDSYAVDPSVTDRWGGGLPERDYKTPKEAFGRSIEYQFDPETGGVKRVRA